MSQGLLRPKNPKPHSPGSWFYFRHVQCGLQVRRAGMPLCGCREGHLWRTHQLWEGHQRESLPALWWVCARLGFPQDRFSLALFCLCSLDKFSLEGKGSGRLGALRVVLEYGLAHTRPWSPLVFEVKWPLSQPTPVLLCFFRLILRCRFVVRGIALGCMDTPDPILHQHEDAVKTVYQNVESPPFMMW